jgi:catechol 2,3-dioxygenase-like lactoylglutathione lyase family enzyme
VPKLSRWYCDTFDMKVVLTTASGATFIQSRNGVTIEVYKSKSEGGSFDNNTPGWRHIAILVEDIEGERSRLAARGVRFEGEIASNPGSKLVRFVDPEGNLGHLVEREKPL